MTRLKKSVRSERGQGGSVAVNADNLSQPKAISCVVSQPAQEIRSDGEIFPPFFITGIALHSLAQSVCPASNLLFYFYFFYF